MLQTTVRRLLFNGSTSKSRIFRAPCVGTSNVPSPSSSLVVASPGPSPLFASANTVSFSTEAKELPPDSSPPLPSQEDLEKAQVKAHLAVKKQLWEFYLSTGRGANALFEAIDLDENGAIAPEELMIFMREGMGDEDPKEIMPYAWNRLEQKVATGQQYDMKHFKKWLVAATKMSADMKNSRLLAYLKNNPRTGDLYINRLPYHDMDDDEDNQVPDVYTWNEETMSQSLRRMQYAVRGEVNNNAQHQEL